MNNSANRQCIAFEDSQCVASGEIENVALELKRVLDSDTHGSVLIFDIDNSRPLELDLRGSDDEILARLAGVTGSQKGETVRRGRGRPKLGVVSREVTLLPRHWAWLAEQSGGASVTLRKLVDQARRNDDGRQRARKAQDAADGFMSAIAGNEPGFEEAIRALYRGDGAMFHAQVANWPEDVKMHALRLATPALDLEDNENTHG